VFYHFAAAAGQCKKIFFGVDVTFEMRTVLYRIGLFNDDLFRHGHHIYIKQKKRERERYNGETESMCERETECSRGLR
jgi:hypothetical protein